MTREEWLKKVNQDLKKMTKEERLIWFLTELIDIKKKGSRFKKLSK